MVIKLFAFWFRELWLLASLLLALLATGADVSGAWSGSIDMRTADGQSNRVAIYLRLKQAGIGVTGTLGPTRDQQYWIEKGLINGDVLTFQVAAPTRVARVRLKVLHGGRMHGEVATEDGQASGEMSVEREADRGPMGRVGRVGRDASAIRDARQRAHTSNTAPASTRW